MFISKGVKSRWIAIPTLILLVVAVTAFFTRKHIHRMMVHQAFKQLPIVCDTKQSLAKPTFSLIKKTWSAHNSVNENHIPIEDFLIFIGDSLDDQEKAKLKSRGKFKLAKTWKGSGNFVNSSEPITLKVKINDDDYQVRIPRLLKGRYNANKDFATFRFEPGYQIKICKQVFWIWWCLELEGLYTTIYELKLDFDDDDYNQCFQFSPPSDAKAKSNTK